jgi:hypothetical protein
MSGKERNGPSPVRHLEDLEQRFRQDNAILTQDESWEEAHSLKVD